MKDNRTHNLSIRLNDEELTRLESIIKNHNDLELNYASCIRMLIKIAYREIIKE